VSTGGNDGYLTFDKGTSAKSMCQGVFFKWGSLVGISPNGGTYVSEWKQGVFDSSIPIYKPTGATTFTKTTTANWADISPMTIPTVDLYAGNYPLAQGNNWSAGTGDICNFIDDDYRLPTWSEFLMGPVGDNTSSLWDSTTPVFGGWTRIDGDWSSVYSTYDDGTSLIVSGASLQGIVFPASGARGYSDGSLSQFDSRMSPGNEGYYWGGSSFKSQASSYYGFSIYFAVYDITNGGMGTNYASPVRCVKIK
jgi:hypothetical protein